MHDSNNIHHIGKSGRQSTRTTRDASHHLNIAASLIQVTADKHLNCRQAQRLRLVAEAIAEISIRLRRLPMRRSA